MYPSRSSDLFKVTLVTPKCSETSDFVTEESCNIAAAFLMSDALSFGLRPPLRPRARAAANPALVRSRIRLCSNSASAPKMWKMSFPPVLVVSMLSVSERNPTDRSSSLWIISTRFFNERPRRSSLQTIRVSPWRNARWHDSHSGRAFLPEPVTLSTNSCSHPTR